MIARYSNGLWEIEPETLAEQMALDDALIVGAIGLACRSAIGSHPSDPSHTRAETE